MKQEMYAHINAVEKSHWWYVARRKIIFDWVLRILTEYPSPRILDVGCGTGFNLEYLYTHNYMDVVGLDFSTEALHFCQLRNLPHLICGNSTTPPFQSETFDVIMALDLIEHLEDDVSALQRLGYMLKPGGTLVIFVPAFNFLWGLQDEVSHHYRRYTARELRQKTELAGLTINKLSYTNMFLFPFIWAGRQLLRFTGNKIEGTSENDLHPGWSNGLLQTIFASERSILRRFNLPVGVSLLCVVKKPIITDKFT